MASINYSTKSYQLIDDDERCENEQNVPTLRDKILKSCHLKQMKTDITLENHQKAQKVFVSGGTEKDVSKKLSGLSKLSEFLSVSEKIDLEKILQASDLNQNEIDELLDSNSSSNEFSNYRTEKFKSILEKINNRLKHLQDDSSSKETFNGAIPVTKRQYEEECKVASCSTIDKITNCLIKIENPNIQDNKFLIHPELVEDLKVLNHQLTSQSKRKLENKNISKENVKKLKIQNPLNSFWDMLEKPNLKIPNENKISNETEGKRKNFPKNIDVCGKNSITVKLKHKVPIENQKKTKTDTSKPFVLLLQPEQLKKKEEIQKNRLTFDELKSEEKFKNYEPGNPSRTLYVKNLPNKVSPLELASFFGHFECCAEGPRINYRILSGKMRGQAFITLKNKEFGVQAFELCNGCYLQGKPMVIEFSKKGE